MLNNLEFGDRKRKRKLQKKVVKLLTQRLAMSCKNYLSNILVFPPSAFARSVLWWFENRMTGKVKEEN